MKMLPLFVLADSDIEEEELKPIILKMKRKLRRLGKRKKRTTPCTESSNNCICHLLKITDIHTKKLNGSVSLKHKISNCAQPLCNCNHDNVDLTNFKRTEDISMNSAVKSKTTSYETDCCYPAKRLKLTPDIPNNVNSCKNPVHLRQTVQMWDSPKHSDQAQALTAINSDDNSKFLALDCEFVGVGPRKTSALGRCSVLDFHGNVLLDIYVRPEQMITDFRTPWSGIRRKNMVSAIPLKCARETIINLLKDKIVIGHALFNDFKVLSISHPWEHVRDTANYKPLREMSDHGGGQSVSLKKLTKALLGRDIQKGEHCSCEDAQAALDLYKLVQSEWEEKLADRKLRRLQRAVTPVVRSAPRAIEVSYLGDEFWPADLFEQSEQKL